MKKFEFRLASVLRLREAQLAAEKEKLHELFSERERLLKNLASIEAERGEAVAFVQSADQAGSRDLRALSAFILGSRARKTTVRQAIESCDDDIERQRANVMAAERNRKLLLNLNDRRHAAWQYAFDRELESVAQEAWQSAARKSGKILASNS